MAKAAADAARAQVESLLVRWVPGMKTLWTTCKFYFAVDSKYVASKLAMIAMPWTTKTWRRRWDTVPVDSSGTTASVPLTPAQDAHAPDLYIPSMSIVTFLLVVGLVKGVSMQFTPEVLSEVTTTCLVTSLLEAAIVYGAIYLTLSSTHVPGVSFLDLFALGAYKYVGLVMALLASLVAGNIGYYAVLAYFAASTTWALFNWLTAALNDAVPVSAAGRTKMVVFVACGLQVLVMVWLARH